MMDSPPLTSKASLASAITAEPNVPCLSAAIVINRCILIEVKMQYHRTGMISCSSDGAHVSFQPIMIHAQIEGTDVDPG